MQEEIYKNLSLEDLPGEEWRDVVGYENYLVSNLGRFKSKVSNRILRQHIVQKYLKVSLVNKNGKRLIASHRAVAIAFIPNNDGFRCINHLDENKLNNRIENLEWCSHSYNNNYGTRNKRISESQRNNLEHSKKVMQFSLDGTFIREWDSICEAGRNGYNRKGISDCCNKEENHRTCNGFLWKFSNDSSEVKYTNRCFTPVLCYDLDMNFIKEYSSIASACRELNVDSGAVVNCCKLLRHRVKNYIFRYK